MFHQTCAAYSRGVRGIRSQNSRRTLICQNMQEDGGENRTPTSEPRPRCRVAMVWIPRRTTRQDAFGNDEHAGGSRPPRSAESIVHDELNGCIERRIANSGLPGRQTACPARNACSFPRHLTHLLGVPCSDVLRYTSEDGIAGARSGNASFCVDSGSARS